MGELARWPGSPELAKTPLEAITPRPGDGYTKAQKYLWPITGFVSGLLTGFCRNFVNRRPIYASMPITMLYSGVLAVAFVVYRDFRFAEKAENDAIIRHYISLHPEDFPPYERKRFAEIYEPFKPVR